MRRKVKCRRAFVTYSADATYVTFIIRKEHREMREKCTSSRVTLCLNFIYRFSHYNMREVITLLLYLQPQLCLVIIFLTMCVLNSYCVPFLRTLHFDTITLISIKMFTDYNTNDGMNEDVKSRFYYFFFSINFLLLYRDVHFCQDSLDISSQMFPQN